MPQISLESLAVLLSTTSTETQQHPASDSAPSKGFGGGGASKSRKHKGDSKPSPAISKADWGPLGKHPDLEAIVARQRLHLPFSSRLRESQVKQAWKRRASEHHADRGAAHDTMQLGNGARDLLVGRPLR
jgi:hypothetical protein